MCISATWIQADILPLSCYKNAKTTVLKLETLGILS